MGTGEDVSIVIVNYNRYKLTMECIKSVIKTVKGIVYEIIVVDNCSTNDSYEILEKKYKKNSNIKIIKKMENKGFGHGNNAGVKLSSYENVLLLNPDVIVLEDSIGKLINRLNKNENIGVIGCKLLNRDMTIQYSCRRNIKIKDFIVARTPLKKIINSKKVNKINREYLMLDYNHKEEREVDWLMGSCLMMKKEFFLKIGGFSKEYFMYFEDVDLGYKVKKEGKINLYYPNVSMIHLHEQASVKKINKLTIIHFISMIKFYKKVIKDKCKGDR